MNALVEDQLTRLRKALDSEQAREFMDTHFNRNRVFIGRFTGKTPITGFPEDHPRGAYNDKKKTFQQSKMRKELKTLEADMLAARDHEDPESRYLFPSVDGNELVTRWDMQHTPPDILITNLAMLNALLMREVDHGILEETRKWIEKDEGYFYLVVDELHLQRGSSGTEMSYLIRILLHRLGLTSPKNRH